MTQQDPPPFLEIKDWRTHQHYGKRRPPWIKLYTRLLDDAAFMALPEAAQAQLVKLWILAAAMCHPLPNDPKFLAGKIGVRGRFYLDVILASGLLVPCYQNASNANESLLAKDASNARPLSTENREQRTETTTRETRSIIHPDQLFEEAWGAYPKRPNNSKAAAWRQWLARVGDGVDPLDMLEGTRRYAKLIAAENTEPKYVKQAATFYGRDRHFESDFTPSVASDSLAGRASQIGLEEDAALARTAELLATRGAA